MPILIRVDDNTAALARRFFAAGVEVVKCVIVAMDDVNLETVNVIQRTKLTAAGPRFLNVQTGRLRGSVFATKARAQNYTVTSSIGSNVVYAAAHEFGAKAHTITAKGKALRFQPGGKYVFRRGKGFIFRKSVKIPALPARQPFRTGIEEQVAANAYGVRFSTLIHEKFSV